MYFPFFTYTTFSVLLRFDCSMPCRFTHVYFFNLGMPDDVVSHTLDLFAKSPTVKYALAALENSTPHHCDTDVLCHRYVIMYPHRSAPLKLLRELGEIVHSQPMRMTGIPAFLFL